MKLRKLKRLTQIIPKAIISTGLATLLTGCSTLDSISKNERYFSYPRIEMYVPAGDIVNLTNCSYMDKNGDGKPDFREIDIETIAEIQGKAQGQSTERTISIVHKYNEKGKLIPAPIVIKKVTELTKEFKDYTEIITTNNELHDCGITELQARYQLPKLQDYHPDGIPDLELNVEIKQYIDKKAKTPQTPAPKQIPRQKIRSVVTL